MSLDTQLRDLFDERLDRVGPPAGDIAAAVGRGRGLRRRRRLAVGACSAVAATSVVLGAVALSGPSVTKADDQAVEPLGQMNFSHGLRAYGDPGHTLTIGGRTVDASGLEWLDTDAVATADGVVYYKDGDLLLVGEDGRTTVLDQGDATPEDFHPTAKGDTGTLVAYALSEGDRVVLKVINTSNARVKATRELDCSAPCDGLVIDGIDSGSVFVRTSEGTRVWAYDDDTLAPFSGPKTYVAGVRNGVVLYSGPKPDGEAATAWSLVEGQIDAQLTYDGRHVLYWSSRLEPTDPSGEAITLDPGSVKDASFFTIDTDGSVLAITPQHRVYDCLIPSGSCEEIGQVTSQGGDPMFIGNDM